MSISVKVSGAWRTVSQPAIKVAGTWRNATAVCNRVGWPNRFASKVVPNNILATPAVWNAGGYASMWGLDTSHPAPTAPGGMRLTWTIDVGKSGFQGFTLSTTPAGRTQTFTITCTDAPAGVPWEAVVGQNPYNASPAAVGNTVTGPGTSTVVWVSNGYGYDTLGIRTAEGANGTAGHLISSITESIGSPVGTVANTGIPFPWKQAWPHPNTGALAIYGVRKEWANTTYGTYPEQIRYTQASEPHFMNGRFNLPSVPHYRIKGDTSQIASAKVTLRFTPLAPKSPVEHTISWDAPVGWGLYHVGYMGTDGKSKFYLAALTDAEATTLKGDATRFVTQLWSPKDGGWFVWMPVCWDASGVTVPMRSEGTADEGLDPFSGYGNFPPNRTATSALADYTVANGYSDMYNHNIVYTAITIELKNSGGTVIASWTGSLAAGNTPDQPGKGNTVTRSARASSPQSFQEYYWPVEWRGLFDNYKESSGSYNVIKFNRDLHDGSAEWIVYDPESERIGDFRLGIRKGTDDTIEIKGVNLKPDLVGMGIMQSIVHHGTVWCPTRYVFIEPPDPITYNVMRSWGWTKFEDWNSRFTSEAFYMLYDYEATDKYLIYDTYVPMYNRFSELGFPPFEAVKQEWPGR
jgi:hypothetical protein